MALLQMTEPAGSSDILEAQAVRVPESAIRHQVRQIWITRAEINVQPAVVIKISKIGAHRMQHPIKAGLLRHIRECAIPFISIKARTLRVGCGAEVIRRNVADVANRITGNEN